jgi:hypothetical protein
MSDERLKQAWMALEPTEAQRVRVEERVVTGWESRQRSLFSEWLDVLRARPLLNGAWMLAAMAVLLFTSPVCGLLAAIPKVQSVELTSRSTAVETEGFGDLLGTGAVVESLAATLGGTSSSVSPSSTALARWWWPPSSPRSAGSPRATSETRSRRR